MNIEKKYFYLFTLLLNFSNLQAQTGNKQPTYVDKPYPQDYSIKYYLPTESKSILKNCFSDRNGNIKILSNEGLLTTKNGQFLYPGILTPDQTYRTLQNKKIQGLGILDQQFILLDNKAVLSNAWAGSLFIIHELPTAKIFTAGSNHHFLVSDGKGIQFINESSVLFRSEFDKDIIDIKYSPKTDLFWLLTKTDLYSFSPKELSLKKRFSSENFTAFDFSSDHKKLILGTQNGILDFDVFSNKQIGQINQKIPVTEITAVKSTQNKTWFGTSQGAFAINNQGKIDYYNGERWLPSNVINHIADGPNGSVLILTDRGLAQICFKNMTLHDKALFFEEQVRQRHIRNGFNASLDNMQKGDLASGYLADSDNDGLWTSMYLGAEIFRYAVTKDKDALQNCLESLDAMERLYTINNIPGFPSRSFERSGYISNLSDPERWQHSRDPEWDWKSTTSSDEAIGHVFAFGAMAELINDPKIKKRAIAILDTLVGHIVKNNYYMIDFDGKPTTWGRWNPEYTNALPEMVGDRKITSSNIIAMLQTAYYFTKKPIYKQKAFELMNKYGYLENLMRPMKSINYAPENASDLAKNLSDAWNHSDDEMYFIGYWGLYRYAFNDTLKAQL